MYVRRNIHPSIILKFAWAYLIFYTVWGIGIVFIYDFYNHRGINVDIPFLPLSTIGIAVAFYISFKNSQSYDRFWEGRKIWGGIVNYSRTWGVQVISFVTTLRAKNGVTEEDVLEKRKELIYRHIAWLAALRHNLRRPAAHSIDRSKHSTKAFQKGTPERQHWDEDVSPFLSPEEYEEMLQHKNVPAQLIRRQGEELRGMMVETGMIEDFRHMQMMRIQEEFYNLQGKCERIKNTPFPRQYAYFSKLFTWIFVLLLPLGLVGEFAKMGHNFLYLTVPFYVLIAWIFMTMEQVGDNSEDPFENFVNDVPMTALSRTIEIDLREMLGETDLPPKVEAENDILL